MKKIFKFSAFFIFFFLAGFIVFIIVSFSISLPKIKGRLHFAGLTSEVQVIRDKWGVPHIYAQNEKDLFFATGFVHAQERMWQMELTRRAGCGRLSELFGTKTVKRDQFLRNLGLKEAAQKDYEKLSPQMKELLLSYCDGVNAWAGTRKFNWPPEFLLLRHRPEPWGIMDSIIIKEIMAFLLSTDYASEAVRAELAETLGSSKALEILEEGAEAPDSLTDEESLAARPASSLPFEGSNNWVLAGSRTQSGKPLLANDPHLEISLPPVWFEIHLQCPTLNVTGVSLPGVPLVIIGHNESIAWGLTNSAADVQDLFLEKIHESGDMYLDEEGWKPLIKKDEVIRVKGKKTPEKMEVLWTKRGPIISPRIVESRIPLSLQWTIYEGGKIFESVYRLNKARNWEEFQEAVRNFDAPSQNFVYADVSGNIGYYLSGKIPLRPEKAALFPYPGWKKEGQWQGYLEEEKKPNLFNPPEGFILTANNKIVPDGYPYYISCDWDFPFRADRIRRMLLDREKHNVESMKRIQNDVYSQKAELFVSLINEVRSAEGKAGKALEIIKAWDLEMNSGAAAALFEVFLNFMNQETFKDELGASFDSFNSLFKRKDAGLIRILADPSSHWFDNTNTEAVEGREDIIKLSLALAYEWLEKKYGPPENWDWTKMHAVKFQHALGQVPVLSFLNKGKYPMNGDSTTIRASFSSGTTTTHGASYRQIIDLSDFKNSLCVISSGQSGHFLSRHSDDQIPLWLAGEYHPMLFDSGDIEANAKGTLLLRPRH
ncbi:MAG: penicillin acylase family protein [Candidatus Aminicenantales bacterium]